MLIREMEGDFNLTECLDGDEGLCQIRPACVLRGVLAEALAGFFNVLDRYTLADLLEPQADLINFLGI